MTVPVSSIYSQARERPWSRGMRPREASGWPNEVCREAARVQMHICWYMCEVQMQAICRILA